MDRVESGQVPIFVSTLLKLKGAFMDFDVLCIVPRIQSDLRVVGILLEIVDQPVSQDHVGSFVRVFLVQDVLVVGKCREVVEDSMGVNFTGLFDLPTTGTTICNHKTCGDECEDGVVNHVSKLCMQCCFRTLSIQRVLC